MAFCETMGGVSDLGTHHDPNIFFALFASVDELAADRLTAASQARTLEHVGKIVLRT